MPWGAVPVPALAAAAVCVCVVVPVPAAAVGTGLCFTCVPVAAVPVVEVGVTGLPVFGFNFCPVNKSSSLNLGCCGFVVPVPVAAALP